MSTMDAQPENNLEESVVVARTKKKSGRSCSARTVRRASDERRRR
jgi:hypothetical protein